MGADIDSNVKATFERASALLRAGDPQSAESVCRDALEQFPSDGNLLCLLGALLVRQQRPVEAEKALRGVVDKFPDFAKAHEELGNALLAQRRPQEAAVCLQRTIELEPANGPAHYKLSKVLLALGRNEDAQDAQKKSSALAPTEDALARAAERRSAGQLQAAEQICSGILAREPDSAEAFQLLAELAMQQQQFGEAVVLFRRVVALAPDAVAAWIKLGQALGERREFDQAIEAIKRAIEVEPRACRPHLIIAGIRSRMARHEEAVAAFRVALEIQPDNAGALLGLGHVLRTIGRHDDAVKTYRKLAARHPDFGEAYWSLANLKNVSFGPDEIEAMEEQLSNENLSAESHIHFCFALGKAYEDKTEYAQAFEFYKRGNSARRQQEHYDAVETQTITDRIIDVFEQRFLEDRAGNGNQDPAPVFIVGLPRSGSTLIEQILASHSQIDGTHELPDLERIIGRITGYPETLLSLNTDDLTELGTQYLESTQLYRAGAAFFTDKMPNNFRHAGLLKLILPNAKVINARRHPLDSCLGCYKQLFFRSQPYTYDLFELGEYYLEYHRLMDHWHQLLPEHVLDLHYEELVSDPEQQIRRLLDYCRLPWEDACLQFHQTERAIESASSEQVRQPIYKTSVNRWRNYEEQLEELIDILQPILKELPENQRPT